MEKTKLLLISIIFLLGFLSASAINFYLVYGLEMPLMQTNNTENIAPSNYIDENQIQVYDDKVVINVENASLGEYASTGSMKPTLDENSNGIRIKPKSIDEISVGDIISFRKNNLLIIHRVIDKGKDENGIYFLTKGDNNNYIDGKVRFSDIEYKTIGVIW